MRVLLMAMLVLAGIVAAPDGAAAQEGTPTAASGEAARTAVRFVLPYTQGGLAAALNVTAEASGACLLPSLADVGRPDAWICADLATNEQFDPCFENPFAAGDDTVELACLASPFATDVVRFTATEPLPRYKDAAPPGAMPAPDAAAMPAPDYGAAPRKGEPAMAPISVAVAAPGASAAAAIDPLDIPWALELANGARCTLLTGATAVLAGERVNYGCEDGGLILGEVDRSAPLWAVSYLADGAFATEFVPVAVAWT